MTNLINIFEKEQIDKLTLKKRIPLFRSGDTLKVNVKIVEGDRSRIQIFEGICIARKNNGLNSSFTIRKISHGEGVERVFPLFSPMVDKIEVVRKGDVKRAKLYYLRKRKGKSARIADKDRGEEEDQYSLVENLSSINDENKEKADISIDAETVKVENTSKEEDSVITKESSTEPVTKVATEEKTSVEEKSELAASKADKAEDESKS